VIGPRAARAWHVIRPHGQHAALAALGMRAGLVYTVCTEHMPIWAASVVVAENYRHDLKVLAER